ncbi:MAG: hypothetical protein ABR533_11880, partial [Desulfonatronovibrio sp.]
QPQSGRIIVNTFRVLFLTAVFAFSMLFLVQNSHVLDTESSLFLDLWWVQLSSPNIAFYVFVFICFIAGLLFGVFTFLPGNRDLRQKLRPIKAKTKELRGEIIAMQKKEEIKTEEVLEQQKDADQSAEHSENEKKFEEPLVHTEKSGGAAGKIALAGVVVLFVVISVFYFHAQQKFQEFQAKVDMTMEKNHIVSQTMDEVKNVNNDVKKEMSSLTASINNQEKKLETHAEMLDDLNNLPQKTMDYLTFMLMKEYAVKIDQLMEDAAEDDQQMLQDILESLDTALEHYSKKK